jgi:YgiT-type zinc finger domain-containing protein
MNRQYEGAGCCPICGGEKAEGTTTFTADLGFGVVVVRHVPAQLCSQCGADWINDENAAIIEQIVDSARKRHSVVEIADMTSYRVAVNL